MNQANTVNRQNAVNEGGIFGDRRKSNRGIPTMKERRQRQFSPGEDWYLRVSITSSNDDK